jgi:hypothetical protein
MERPQGMRLHNINPKEAKRRDIVVVDVIPPPCKHIYAADAWPTANKTFRK